MKSCGGAAPVSPSASLPAGSPQSRAAWQRVTRPTPLHSFAAGLTWRQLGAYVSKSPLKPISKSQNISPLLATGSSQGAVSPPSLRPLPASSGSRRQRQDGVFSWQGPRWLPGWCGAWCPRHMYAHTTLDELPAESLLQNHPPHAAARSFWFHCATVMLQVPAPLCLPIPPPIPGGEFFPPALQEEFAYAEHRFSLQCSARTALTNPNSFSCSSVPSAAVTDGCCERRGVAIGNNQNRSTRLWEQCRCSQPSSGWIPLQTSAGGRRSPCQQAAALGPGPGNMGSLGTGKSGFGAGV